MLNPVLLSESLRIFKRSVKAKLKGIKRYKGNAKQICQQIVNDCWNGTYFQTSNGHFCQFYCRDFGLCTDSLLELGYVDEVRSTLDYALNIFQKHNRVMQTINPKGVPFELFRYSPDSLAFILRSLSRLNSKELIEKYRDFLNKEISRYYKLVIDKETGLVKKQENFSSMKDHSIRTSSCYNNVMAAMLENNIKQLGLENPFRDYNYKKIIKENFWKDGYFIDDLSGHDFITGDANVFPFWSGVFDEQNMLKSAVKKIREENLDRPFPLKYYHKKEKEQKMTFMESFLKNYERDTVWMHLGQAYIDIVKKVDKGLFIFYINQYKKLVEKHKNYLEVFNPDGTPYKSPFYYCDESMLWASMLLRYIK